MANKNWRQSTAVKFLFFFVLIIGWFILADTARAQVACGSFDKKTFTGSCNPGTPSSAWFDSASRAWRWTCSGGGEKVDCQYLTCGDNQRDSMEDCDGSDLDGKVCTDFPDYTGGTLGCNNQCLFDFGKCTKPALCGNSIVDQGEQCDSSNLNGQTCQSLYKVDGALACWAKGTPKECAFDNRNCLLCGNGVKQGTEQCDGTDLGGKKCTDFQGFTGGFLGCQSCVYDFSGCTGGSQGICGNGRREPGEDCDGFDLGDATCTSLGCGTGDLQCNRLICKYDKSSCSDPTCSGQQKGCLNKTTSDWSKFQGFTKPCCGEADGQILDEAPSGFSLCTGGGFPSPVKEVFDASGKILTRWTWSCGLNSCTAYVKAHCAGELAEEATIESDCSPGVTFKNENAFNAAVEARKKINPTQPLCYKGIKTDGGNCSDSGWNPSFNREWLCVGEAPAGQKNDARCIVGWAPPSKCGSLNGKTYTVPPPADCSQSEFFQVENKSINPELCAVGSTLVNASKKYLPDSFPWHSLDENYPNRQFAWQCQSVFGSRRGAAVDCAVNLSGTCSSSSGKCGNDAKGHFAYPSDKTPNPFSSLCLIGQGQSLIFNSQTYTWTWKCRPVGGQSVDCSVTAEAVCGSANGGDYATEAEVRAVGACAKGRLSADKIYDRGAKWEWTCESPADANAHISCSASTTRCGHAGLRAFLTSTFDAKKNNSGFLCASGTTAQNLAGPTYDQNFRRSDWTWKCGSRDCRATKLECGFGDNGAYHIASDFNVKRQAWSSFLCSGGGSVGLWKDPTSWTWGCAGADGDTVSGCVANEYRCGDLKGKSISWAKFYELFNVTSGQACAGKSATSDLLCPGGVAVCLMDVKGESGGAPTWMCQTPAPEGKYITTCSAKVLSCGSANNKWYYQTTLDNNNNKDNGFLCSGGATNSTISYSKDSNNIVNHAAWQCNGYNNSTVSCSAGVINCGFGNGRTYSGAGSFYNACSKDDGSTCLCTNTNLKSSPRLPSFLPNTGADWQCTGDSGEMSCHANGEGNQQ